VNNVVIIIEETDVVVRGLFMKLLVTYNPCKDKNGFTFCMMLYHGNTTKGTGVAYNPGGSFSGIESSESPEVVLKGIPKLS